MPKRDQLSAKAELCAVECVNCNSICLRMIGHCLSLGGPHAKADHIGLLINCAEICQATENFLLTASPELSSRLTKICAEVCEECADSCDQLGEDPQMKACASICRVCASACQGMLTKAAA